MLLSNVPGKFVALKIPFPSDDIVSFKKIFKKLSRRHEDNIDHETFFQPPLSGGRKTHIDNIIDILERKYRGHTVADSDSDDSNSDFEAEFVDEMSNLERKRNIVTSMSNRSKKVNTHGETYDMDDPFVDDDELISQVNTEIRTKRVKTKHEGFFVSRGTLELAPAPIKAPKLQIMKPPAGSSNSISQPPNNVSNKKGHSLTKSGSSTVASANSKTSSSAHTTKASVSTSMKQVKATSEVSTAHSAELSSAVQDDAPSVTEPSALLVVAKTKKIFTNKNAAAAPTVVETTTTAAAVAVANIKAPATTKTSSAPVDKATPSSSDSPCAIAKTSKAPRPAASISKTLSVSTTPSASASTAVAKTKPIPAKAATLAGAISGAGRVASSACGNTSKQPTTPANISIAPAPVNSPRLSAGVPKPPSSPSVTVSVEVGNLPTTSQEIDVVIDEVIDAAPALSSSAADQIGKGSKKAEEESEASAANPSLAPMKPPKPQFIPGPIADAAMQVFKESLAAAVAAGMTIVRQAFPAQMEAALLEMDLVVKQQHPKELSRTVGYYESVAEWIGGGVTVGKVRG